MSDPFIGEIRIFSFSFAPKYWAFCDGQILPVNQNQALYALLGNQFGGSSPTSFALPDLRGRAGLDDGPSSDVTSGAYLVGQTGGAESVSLTTANIPLHDHNFNVVASAANKNLPTGNFYAQVSASPTPNTIYAAPSTGTTVSLHPSTITNTGGNGAHANMQPFAVLNFCIATAGLFPPRN